MIKEYADDASVLEYLESFALALARGIENTAVVRWDDLAGICDQRYFSLTHDNPIALNCELLDKCDADVKRYLLRVSE